MNTGETPVLLRTAYSPDSLSLFRLCILGDAFIAPTGRSYYKWISSLEIIAKVRTFVVRLDLKCDALVLEMLQNFLKSMRMIVLPSKLQKDHIAVGFGRKDLFRSRKILATLSRREEANIKPHTDVDIFIKGEMLVGPAKTLFMYEKSTGLDSNNHPDCEFT
ncbi:hypothetical protein HHK36_011396 [Tetracentron sinense]|uniref:Uncharacterized protein n=1 Tax=Tetracentron sinense TaxID=13715 RepID=A0A835DKD8_TETSI|nr:hypothetical protein HHK36_011396 [Tetracentron sinense]